MDDWFSELNLQEADSLMNHIGVTVSLIQENKKTKELR